jgi:hypothetical protein
LLLRASTSQTVLIGAKFAGELVRRSAAQREVRWSCRSVLARTGAISETDLPPGRASLLFSGGPSSVRLEQVSSRMYAPYATADAWTESPETSIPSGFLSAFELSDVERNRLVRSVVSSQALEGVDLPYRVVDRLVDQVLLEPPIELG